MPRPPRGGKTQDETIDPKNTSKESQTQADKGYHGNQPQTSSQPTIDKHLKQKDNAITEDLQETMKGFADKLTKLTSQEFIEQKLRALVTQDFMTTKLADLEKELKSEIKKEVDTVHEVIRKVKERVKTTEADMLELKNKLSDMETTVEQVKAEHEKLKVNNKELKEQMNDREIMLKKQSEDINDLEQYTRKKSVRIYGLKETNPKESSMATFQLVVKMVNDKLELNMTTADIDIAHRIGKYKNDANRPVICKLVSRFMKYDIIRARRKLKGTVMVIREYLTNSNVKLIEKVSKHDSVKTVWSDDGKILALLKNDRKMVIDARTDLSKSLLGPGGS